MKLIRILLLDFEATSELGDALAAILDSLVRLDFQFEQERVHLGRAFSDDGELAAMIARFEPGIVILALAPYALQQAEPLFQFIKERFRIPVMVAIEAGEPDELFELLRLGTADFITQPFKAIDLLPRIWRLLERSRREDSLEHRLKEKFGLKQLVGESRVFLAEIKKIPLIARCDASILVCGETGTGKELCARAIHYLSPRAGKPFIPINCGAVPVELVENELFGHERGAFTGATGGKTGLIQEANGGTLFLDEIDCLPPLAQVKFLRFLQEKEYKPLGATRMRRADVRVIAATNADLEDAVETGKLRKDLYYRLNIIPLTLPALRERREDIPLLVSHFLAKYNAEFDKQIAGLSPEAMQLLTWYDWPGNVRELEHMIQRVVVLCEQPLIRSDHILLPQSASAPRQESFQQAKARVIMQFEKRYIKDLLLAYQGNITKASQAANKNRRAFWQLIRKHRINAQSFKHVSS